MHWEKLRQPHIGGGSTEFRFLVTDRQVRCFHGDQNKLFQLSGKASEVLFLLGEIAQMEEAKESTLEEAKALLKE